MTETEWLAGADPQLMLKYLRSKISDRKLRLFAGAYCRRIWGLLTDPRSRAAVLAAEQYADGLITEDELKAAREAAWEAAIAAAWVAVRTAAWAAAWAATSEATGEAVWEAVWAAASEATMEAAREATIEAARAAQAHILRDIAGNPFRLVPRTTVWQVGPQTMLELIPRSRTVFAMARAIYDDCRFEDLPILADALEDADCDNAEILNHCRLLESSVWSETQQAHVRRSQHVRGCWVLDLILGKE